MQGIDLNKVYHSAAPAVIRLTALELSRAPSYTRPGEWLAKLTDADLEYLMIILDQVDDTPDNPYTESMILLAMILAQAEGVDSDHQGVAHKHVSSLAHFLVLESLYRKGAADLIRDNMSFGDDAKDLPIASPRGMA